MRISCIHGAFPVFMEHFPLRICSTKVAFVDRWPLFGASETSIRFSDYPLWTGNHYSQVSLSTGLTVLIENFPFSLRVSRIHWEFPVFIENFPFSLRVSRFHWEFPMSISLVHITLILCINLMAEFFLITLIKVQLPARVHYNLILRYVTISAWKKSSISAKADCFKSVIKTYTQKSMVETYICTNS